MLAYTRDTLKRLKNQEYCNNNSNKLPVKCGPLKYFRIMLLNVQVKHDFLRLTLGHKDMYARSFNDQPTIVMFITEGSGV